MRSDTIRGRAYRQHLLAAAVMLALAGAAHGQVSTSTIKGQVSQGAVAAQGGLMVTAFNLANGNTYRTTTKGDGSYVLPGLAPGSYEIRVTTSDGGTVRSEQITVAVGETAAADLVIGAPTTATTTEAGTQRIEITGSATRRDVKDSQVGTSVSNRMIAAMPQSTRNFMSSADLAPGVAFVQDGGGNTSLQSGASNRDNVNVFIDGIGQKNNILRGGITGQDSSRGNPFPQSAIAEYKVLTQNYKAEFDQVSSAAITAITKSGGNEFHGEVYVDRTGTNWREKTPLEKANEKSSGLKLPSSTKYEYGASLGGPIIQDKVHFFVAYDGKKIDDSRLSTPQDLSKFPDSTVGILPSLVAMSGTHVDPFTEHLVFGKIDAQLNDDQKLTLTTRLRREKDTLPEERRLSSPDNVKSRRNDETRVDLLHEWTIGDVLAETRVGYEDYRWNPHSSSTDPLVKYKVSTASPVKRDGSSDVYFIGGSPDAQDRQQKGQFISEDVTYTGVRGHVIKGGVRFKAMKYDLQGSAFSVPTIETVIDPVTGQPYYDPATGLCTGTNLTATGLESDQCLIRAAMPASGANFRNNQIGLYIQDDWTVTKQLEVNVGLRWDYESNMLNNGYVTPQDRVDALYGPDTRTGIKDAAGNDIVPAAGQTYADSLAKSGIDIADFISTGRSRKKFKNAFAPRLGFSYDLFGDRASVVYGGYGRSYDRTMANNALDEKQKNAVAGGEIWLIRNDFKMPYSDQFTIGLRQALADWNLDVAFSHVIGKNQFAWYSGNRDPNGGWDGANTLDPYWSGGPQGYGHLILGDFVGRTKTNSLLAKLEKPYTRASGWQATIAYTYTDAKTTAPEWDDGIFHWTYGKPGVGGWNVSRMVDKHRIVGAVLMDNLLPWGLTFSAKGTYASGKPRRMSDCRPTTGGCAVFEGGAPSYRQVDIGAIKEFKLGNGQALAVRMDVLNVFGTASYSGFDDGIGGVPAVGAQANRYGGDNLSVDKPNTYRGDPRTLRLGVSYRF